MKKCNKINGMVLFFFLLPIVDFITLFSPMAYKIGFCFKGILVLYAFIYLIKNTKNKKIFAFLGIYFFVYICYLFTNACNPWLGLSNILTIFSLPLLILFFTTYYNKALTKKTITILFFLYLILFFVSSLFRLPLDNSFLNLFILLFSITFLYLIESNSYLLKALYLILFFLAALFIPSKTFYISIFIILIYYLIINLKKIKKSWKKQPLKPIVTILVICLALAIYLPQLNIKNALENNSIKEIFTYQNLNTLSNDRLTHLSTLQNEYKNREGLEKLLGIGIEKTDELFYLKGDIFTIFYSIGILGMLFYLFFFVYVLKNSHLKKNYAFTFFFLVLFSSISSSIANPYLIPFISLLFLLSKNDNGMMKKDILMVSNMYPNKQHPHYGIFVKNTYDVLKEEHSIDLVVMHKTKGKVKKLISYIKMCGLSLLKATFENYDFVYVHFVSHTPAGVFIPVVCSKNTKFVLNVHGNDIVADTNVDKNYLYLSRLFLKRADIVISPSKYFEKILRKEYHIVKGRIVVYPAGGVNTHKFKKINKKTAIKNAGLDSKYKYFGFIARIEKNKGYDTYVKAIYELEKKKKYKDVRYLLVGSGSEEEKLNSFIQQYKLENVIIRKPLVSQEELVNIYNALEAFAYPTRMQSESLGLTGLEAMACETLVIGSNKYGPSDYLVNNENSFTFTPANEKELASLMEKALKLKVTEKNKLTKMARKKSEEYSFEATKDILLNVFSK